MQDKPRLIVRLAVALIAFVIGITSTLLFNSIWPSSHATQSEVRRVLLVSPPAGPQPLTPCMGHDPAMQPAFVWMPAEPPAPPAPPEPPQPPARAHRH